MAIQDLRRKASRRAPQANRASPVLALQLTSLAALYETGAKATARPRDWRAARNGADMNATLAPQKGLLIAKKAMPTKGCELLFAAPRVPLAATATTDPPRFGAGRPKTIRQANRSY
jgi:hypothetical protein